MFEFFYIIFLLKCQRAPTLVFSLGKEASRAGRELKPIELSKGNIGWASSLILIVTQILRLPGTSVILNQTFKTAFEKKIPLSHVKMLKPSKSSIFHTNKLWNSRKNFKLTTKFLSAKHFPNWVVDDTLKGVNLISILLWVTSFPTKTNNLKFPHEKLFAEIKISWILNVMRLMWRC